MVSRSARALSYGVVAALLTGCSSGRGAPPPQEQAAAAVPAPAPPRVTLNDVKSAQEAQAQEIARLGQERPGEVTDLVDRAEQIVFELGQQRVTSDFAHIEVLLKEVDRVNRIIEMLLDLGRPVSMRPVPLNIHQLLERVALMSEATAAEHGIQIVRRYDPSLPPILADEDKILQVFHNLVRNGIEAMPGNPPLAPLTLMESSEQPFVSMGGYYSLRGYYDGRFAGPGKLLGGIEARYALLWAPSVLEVKLVGFYDVGRVFGPGEEVAFTTEGLHHGGGGEIAVRFGRNSLITAGVGFGAEGSQFLFGTTWSY